ncbi:hypothetical protein B0T11DRAFT_294519 [Plectosphaerella cucumerina]|uniref:Uncharacterized protein n=1 Tax=Plectosphaerella cucumerina TaxID=40658 RepID=A0A8K0TUK6_9PEZI|nr:hypothetical protein B0T11DRAFT_294519 [Plectosphaerella cucumerina]
MPRSEPLDDIARRYRRIAHRLRSVLSQGLRLDGNLCDTVDQLGGPRAPPSRVRTVLSHLRNHARRSSKYHGELEALIGSMAAQLTESLGELPPTEEVTESLGELPPTEEVTASRDILPPRKRLRLSPDWSALPLVALRRLLSYLCASDVAVFLWATGIQKYVPYNEIKPFLQYHRDLPLRWRAQLNCILSHGHKILLVGSDIEQLHMRIHRPLEYWRAGGGERILNLWLALRFSPQALEKLARKRRSDPSISLTVDENGRLKWKRAGGTFVPFFFFPGGSLQPTHPAWTNWQTYDTDSRIRLLILPERPHCPWEEIPRVRICPTARDGGHVVQRWNGVSACNPIGPGTVKVRQNLFPGPVPPDFALPFIDLGTGQRGVSGPIEREPGPIHIQDKEAAGLLFSVEFECCCNLLQVNHQVHGLWQIQ